MNPPIRTVTLVEPTSASVIWRKRVSLFSRPLANGSPLIMFSRVIPLLLLVWLCGGAFGQSQITVNKYYIDNGHGNCTTWGGSDTACASLSVTVNGDAVPGDYTYDLLCNPDIIGDGGNVVRTCCGYGHQTTIHVNADHSYTVDPDPGLACMGNAGGKGLSHLYLSVSAPADSVHSEGDVNINVDSIYCA